LREVPRHLGYLRKKPNEISGWYELVVSKILPIHNAKAKCNVVLVCIATFRLHQKVIDSGVFQPIGKQNHFINPIGIRRSFPQRAQQIL